MEEDNINDEAEEEKKEDEILSEGAEYSPKSEFSKPEVVKVQVIKCNEVRSKEMREGYSNETLSNAGTIIKTWIPDERKIFIGAVNSLKNLLTPEILEEKEFKDFEKNIEKGKKEIFDKFCYHPAIKKLNEKNEGVWVRTGQPPFIPHIGCELYTNDLTLPRSKFVRLKKGLWDINVNLYWDQMVEFYDDIFSELNRLIHLKNYFKQNVSF